MDAPYPGMDRKSCPDLGMMQRLFDSGSFCWTGYYFAPTNAAPAKDSSWMGQRAALVEQGWGIAPIYWGYQQDDAGVATWTTASAQVHGRADSLEAATRAFDEGFPDNTVIFLDLEAATTPTTAAFVAYIEEWFATLGSAIVPVPGGGAPPQYRPGVYVHQRDIIANTYGLGVHNADRWLTGGPAVVGTAALDGWGWPLRPEPSDVGTPCSMWQWGLGVVLERRGGRAVGYRVTDYDGTVHSLFNDLDYDSSSSSDPSSTSGDAVINDVVSVATTNAGAGVVGGRDVLVRVRLGKPAAHPLGVDVVVTDRQHTVRGRVAAGDREVTVTVPTDPVGEEAVITYTARTAWWQFSRAHAGMTTANEPEAHSADATVRPPRVLQFVISPKVKVKAKGRGTVILEAVPVSGYRVQLRSTSKVNGNMLLKYVPADVGFDGAEGTFEFEGAWGTKDGVTATIQVLFWRGNTTANTEVISE